MHLITEQKHEAKMDRTERRNRQFNNNHGILSIMDRTTLQENNKKTEHLNNTANQLDLTNIYRTFHQ